MSRTTSSNKPEQERSLLNKRSLETCPPELRQSLAYVLHLRSYWKPEGRAKLIVPTSWMAFLAFADGKCGTECVANQQCPFGSVRFESVAEARLDIPDEELPRDIVSQLLTNVGMDSCLATVVVRAFQGIPRTSPRSDMPATSLSQSQGTPRRIDFALVLGDDVFPENNTRCLLLGMKEPPRMQDPPAASFDSSTFASIPEALTSHGQFHLTLLTSLMQGGAAETTTEAFPEWLVLFGLTFDAHAMRIIAYLPRRRKMDVIDCAAYVVDELSLDAGSVPACEVLLERLRLLLALTTLRRHVLYLSKSLFTSPRDGIGRTGHPCDRHNSDDSESLKRCGSVCSGPHCSSQYSTCPSSVHARGSNDVPGLECGQGSCRSFASSSCSTCSNLLESASTSDSFYSDYTDSNNFTEPSTMSLSQGTHESAVCPSKLTETKRREIVAWARQVIRTEHPVKDTYKMVVHHPHPRRRRVGDSKSNIQADRHY